MKVVIKVYSCKKIQKVKLPSPLQSGKKIICKLLWFTSARFDSLDSIQTNQEYIHNLIEGTVLKDKIQNEYFVTLANLFELDSLINLDLVKQSLPLSSEKNKNHLSARHTG